MDEEELIEEEDADVIDSGPNEHIWERLPDEPTRWYSRFLLYRDLGPTRTLIGSLRAEEAQRGITREDEGKKRYCGGAWRKSAEQFRWKERAEAWDEYRRRVTFNSGYASDLTRISKLGELAERLEEKITAMLGKMKDQSKFSPFLVLRYLEVLDAIAKETGGRRTGIDLEATVSSAQRVVFFLPETGEPNDDIDLTMTEPERVEDPN